MSNFSFKPIDSIPDGQTPHTVTLCVYDALVDVARPGDRYGEHVIHNSLVSRLLEYSDQLR